MRQIIILIIVFFTTTFPAKSQDLPSIGEVFDFQVDDEFHYFNSDWFWAYYGITKIIDVDYNVDSSEVVYTSLRYSHEGWIIDSSTLFEQDTIYLEYTNLDSSIYYYDEFFNYDTLYYLNDDLCGVNIFVAYYHIGGTFPESNKREYSIGLGLTGNSSSSDTGFSIGGLVYYKKNGVECGTPIDISVGIDSSVDLKGISVFPTLFKDIVTIESNNKDDLTIQVYSLSGHEILTKRLTSSSFQLDFSFVRSGSYIYVIRNAKGNQVIKTGKIIKSQD